MNNHQFSLIPSGITILRIILSFIFAFLLLNGHLLLSVLILTIAILTDAIDGYLARKLNSNSFYGAYLDITADFILVLISFIVFAVIGIYPYWVIFLIVIVFLQFILTSKLQILVYDPVGKYYGSFLFGMILITIITPPYIHQYLLVIIVLYTLISLLSRYLALFIKKRK
jgi:CDP-diacylglycerol--glycerol-3-phosphate 3-phosphatidyltransferase/cardiolipin synthase